MHEHEDRLSKQKAVESSPSFCCWKREGNEWALRQLDCRLPLAWRRSQAAIGNRSWNINAPNIIIAVLSVLPLTQLSTTPIQLLKFATPMIAIPVEVKQIMSYDGPNIVSATHQYTPTHGWSILSPHPSKTRTMAFHIKLLKFGRLFRAVKLCKVSFRSKNEDGSFCARVDHYTKDTKSTSQN